MKALKALDQLDQKLEATKQNSISTVAQINKIGET
jgi:hypothetical protein